MSEFNVFGHTYDPSIHAKVSRITAARIEGKEMDKRRPPTALRFQADDWTRLILKPRLLSSPTGWKVSDAIDAELRKRVDSQGSSFPALELKVSLKGNGVIVPRRWKLDMDRSQRAFEDLCCVLDLLATDPAQVLSKGSSHCCICGKSLSDPVSQARGIGPECVKVGDWLLRLFRERQQ